MKREKSIGIDPAKRTLVAYSTESKKTEEFSNSGKGIKKLIKFIKSQSPDVVTIETTSCYHRKASRAIVELGVSLLLAQPRRVREFSSGLGILGKTDKIDARCIALYGLKCDLPESSLPSEEDELLKDIVSRRQQLVELRVREKNRMGTAPKELKDSLKRTIKSISKEIEKIEVLINNQLEKCKELKAKSELIVTAKGIGKTVSAVIVSYLPELGSLTKAEVASLSGLAPFNRDSGGMKGKRSIYGGRTTVRSALYMAAMSASRHCPILSKFYQNLLKRGKIKRVALVAVMRKLIIILNSMVKNNCEYRAPESA